MSRLRLSRCYLCGAMDRVSDGGTGWRERTKQVLSDLGILWLDPTRKPIDIGIENEETRAERKLNKSRGQFDPVSDEMRRVRNVDLRMVDICDFLIINLDMSTHACGTYEELFLANRQKKPVFLHIEQSVYETPDWLFGTLPYDYFHSDWCSLYNHVKYVAYSKDFIDTTGRWYFFNWMGGNG